MCEDEEDCWSTTAAQGYSLATTLITSPFHELRPNFGTVSCVYAFLRSKMQKVQSLIKQGSNPLVDLPLVLFCPGGPNLQLPITSTMKEAKQFGGPMLEPERGILEKQLAQIKRGN